jgi:hypothetical protein
MFQSLYKAVKNESFVDSVNTQTNFFQQQQNKYQGVEPNRFLPDSTPVQASELLQTTKDAIKSFDPYTEKSSVPFNDQVLGSLLQGTPAESPMVAQCRRYIGLSGLEQMIREQAADPNNPIRCGFRYQKSNGVSPAVAQGAYGTTTGPISKDVADQVGGNVRWIWDLQEAKRTLIADSANNLGACVALSTLPAIDNGVFTGNLGYCTESKKFIPISRGKAAYPNLDTLNCPPEKIVTNAANCPVVEGFNDTAATDQACLASGSASLTRDCLLRAVQMAGCSDSGSMYAALQSSQPGGPYDSTLSQQKAFQDYQSSQGSAAITQSLFNANTATMNLALTEIGRLKSAIQSSVNMKTKKAAEDLCLRAGIYDTYDFCSDITDNTPITSVDFGCIQKYWQSKNGKPAGTAYPQSATSMQLLNNPRNWKAYKEAVDALEAQTRSQDGLIQQTAFQRFYGVQPGPTPQIRVPVDSSTKGVEVIYFDNSLQASGRGRTVCILSRRMNLAVSNRGIPVVSRNGPIPSGKGTNVNVGFFAFWDFRVSQNSRLFLRTFTDDGFRYTVNRTITDDGGSADDTFSRYYDQGPTTHTNLNTAGLRLDAEKVNVVSLTWYNNGGGYVFTNEFALQPVGGSMPALQSVVDTQGILNAVLKDACLLTQEISAPYISIEVCRRTISRAMSGAFTANNGTIAFQDRRMFSSGVELQRNGNTLFQVDSQSRSTAPANVPFVRLRDGESFVSFSKIAFQALQTFTLCFRIPVTMTSNQSFSLFSWINLEQGQTSRIGYTCSVVNTNTVSTLRVEVKGNQGVTTIQLPVTIQTGANAPWYLLVVRTDQFEQHTQGIQMIVKPIEQFRSNAVFGFNETSSLMKPSTVPYFFTNYSTSPTMRGELRFGGVGTIDIAWFHGYDYKLEEGEQLRREATNGWVRTWFESDL